MLSTWTDDYKSGIKHVDDQHKYLFHIVNTFIDSNDKQVSNAILDQFLDELLHYCGVHFQSEEELMSQTTFPMTDHHVKSHYDLGVAVKRVKHQLKQNTLKDPFESVSALAISWLNDHIIQDDLTFFNFYANSGHSFDSRLLGRHCVIHKIDNSLLGHGKIISIAKNEVDIANANDVRMAVVLNEIVKVTTTGKGGAQTFVAQVYVSRHETLKLFNATLIQVVNNRKHSRVLTDVDATVYYNHDSFPGHILDIGMGGVKLETNKEMTMGDIVGVDFPVLNSLVSEMCEVRRVVLAGIKSYAYGLMFKSLDSENAQKIGAFVFNKQVMERQGVK